MGKKIEGGGTKGPVLRPNRQITVIPNKNTEKCNRKSKGMIPEQVPKWMDVFTLKRTLNLSI